MKRFSEIGLAVPEVLLPRPGVDLSKWAVVACDQYTSQPDYWDEVARLVGTEPSTLKLIYPEVYLGKEDPGGRIKQIQQQMQFYLDSGLLTSNGPGFIYIDRQTAHVKSRKGLLVLLDLEQYDYRAGSKTLIRATEGTVLERIPPRVKIREEASLELPHVMVLIDDPDRQVIEPLAQNLEQMEKLYDFELMMNGGRVTGYKVSQENIINRIQQGLGSLADPAHFNRKYGVSGQELLLYAVGDGNHSLATAKAVWEKLKQTTANLAELMERHPARYALIELVNVHDPGLQFEPIHRVVFNIDKDVFFNEMKLYFSANGSEVNLVFETEESIRKAEYRRLKTAEPEQHLIEFIAGEQAGLLIITNPHHNLEVGSLQLFLDQLVQKGLGLEVDYIHGDQVVKELAAKPGNIGFYLPPLSKGDLFKTVILDGVLPRKTFSMGEAEEKRFYLECRKIK